MLAQDGTPLHQGTTHPEPTNNPVAGVRGSRLSHCGATLIFGNANPISRCTERKESLVITMI